MNKISLVKRIAIRTRRILTGNIGVYCKKGKHNHIAKGTILYEPAIIGNYNYFAPYSLIYNAHIGNYCSIGPGCRIGLAEHDISSISTRSIVSNGSNDMKMFDFLNPTVIENDVWIGANVVIKQGVHIANGAVVGAGAIVTHDIPSYAIAYGVPAKIMSYRFDEEKIKKIQGSEWYQKDIHDCRIIVKSLAKE